MERFFMKASRRKLRFNINGNLAPEDLWVLPMSTLETEIKKINASLESNEVNDTKLSFLKNRNVRKTQAVLDQELRFEILKAVITTRLEEAEKKEKAAEKKEKREKLLKRREELQNSKVGEMTEEQIDAELKKLDEDDDE